MYTKDAENVYAPLVMMVRDREGYLLKTYEHKERKAVSLLKYIIHLVRHCPCEYTSN
jgi:hypothetical protein